MADQPACLHTTVRRAMGKNAWHCRDCGLPFVSVTESDEITSGVLDTIAGTMSAMLWDFHQRAVDHYGQQVAGAVAPNATYEYTEETCPGHQFEFGTCELCGTSVFLGGDK